MEELFERERGWLFFVISSLAFLGGDLFRGKKIKVIIHEASPSFFHFFIPSFFPYRDGS